MRQARNKHGPLLLDAKEQWVSVVHSCEQWASHVSPAADVPHHAGTMEAIERPSRKLSAELVSWLQLFSRAMTRREVHRITGPCAQKLLRRCCTLLHEFSDGLLLSLVEAAIKGKLYKVWSQPSCSTQASPTRRAGGGVTKNKAKQALSWRRAPDFDVLLGEVVERLPGLRGYQVVRVLQAFCGVRFLHTERDMLELLVRHVAPHFSNLDVRSLESYVPLYLAFASKKTQAAFGPRFDRKLRKKLRGFTTADRVLRAGFALALADRLTLRTLNLWLFRLHNLDVLTRGDHDVESGGILKADVVLEERTSSVLTHAPADGKDEENDERDAEGLQYWRRVWMLQVFETCPPVDLQFLQADSRSLLERAAGTELSAEILRKLAPEDPEKYRHVWEQLKRAVLDELEDNLPQTCSRTSASASSSSQLQEHCFGPFVCSVVDLGSRTVFDWESPWTLYPPFKQVELQQHFRRKWAYLEKNHHDWKLTKLPPPRAVA
eukprot:g3221.t1